MNCQSLKALLRSKVHKLTHFRAISYLCYIYFHQHRIPPLIVKKSLDQGGAK